VGYPLIRAAAKNYENTVCICSSSQYQKLIDVLNDNCSTDISYRKRLAVEAFNKSLRL
jgi:AICAR transformylase/IMP cyclohydrolase PurH